MTAVATAALALPNMRPLAPLAAPVSENSPALTDAATSAETWPAGLEVAAPSAIEADAYAVVAPTSVGGAWGAANPAHSLTASFSPTGVSVRPVDGGWTWDLDLRADGYEGALAAARAPELTADANRVEYRRGPLTEWYVNDATGVEQGFTLTAPPAASGAAGTDAPLVVELGLTGTLDASLDPDGNGLTLTGPGGSLRYDGLVAYDATGRDLPARMSLGTGTLRLEVDETGAAYPLTIDPFVYAEEARLTASDAAASDLFGGSVAVDGDTAVVGAASSDTEGGSDAGSAYVFVRDGSGWSQQAKLTASDGAAGHSFGAGVALSGDTAVVGATGSGVAGSAYVFIRDGTAWPEQAQLVPSDGSANDLFGSAVAVSGHTALVGAYLDDTAGGSDAGSAYVFVRDGSVWSEQAHLLAPFTPGPSRDYFGGSLDISGDTAVVGARLDDPGLPKAGSAYVFVRDGSVWSEQAHLVASDAASFDEFGYSVAVSGDTVAVGAGLATTAAGSQSGSAYVFVRDGTTWSEQAKLTASDGGASTRSGPR